ncbi:G patch domain-containing protein 1, partial [Clarias magur]
FRPRRLNSRGFVSPPALPTLNCFSFSLFAGTAAAQAYQPLLASHPIEEA